MVPEILDFILHLDIHLTTLIQQYGSLVYILLFAIIFMETGFVLTPFLPGDSLLFLAGAFAATSNTLNVFLLFSLLFIAAILGDTANYWAGHYAGLKVFSRFIKPEHLERTKLFFHNHGKKTIMLARFVPIIRTFAPFVAGIGKMDYFIFLGYNIIGGVSWVGMFVFAGYFFGNIPIVKDNLMIIVLLIVIISFIPAIREYWKHQRKKSKIESTEDKIKEPV